jgi:tetraacyldisaccharide 4'-kinase
MPAQRSTLFFADEARMQAATVPDLPVIVGQDRRAAAKRYLAHHPAPSHWILDDGLQHLKIHRDIDLVCLDAARPYAEHLLLPAGSLREPVAQLSRAHALIFTRYKPDYDAIVQSVLKRFPLPHLLVPFTVGTPYHVAGPHLFTLHGQQIRALSAIADAQQFFHGLLSLGLNITETVALSDHQTFTKENLNGKLPEITTIVTTAKDYWRNPEIFNEWGGSVYVAPLKTDITDEAWDRLFAAIMHARNSRLA